MPKLTAQDIREIRAGRRKVMTAEECAAYLQVSVRTLQRLAGDAGTDFRTRVADGERCVRYRLADVERFLTAQRSRELRRKLNSRRRAGVLATKTRLASAEAKEKQRVQELVPRRLEHSQPTEEQMDRIAVALSDMASPISKSINM